MSPSDEQLMLQFQDGSQRAFEELVRRYSNRLLTFILRLVGDRDQAEDILQETYYRVVRHAPFYEVRGRFSTWLFTIAHNQCVSHLRTRGARPPSLSMTRAENMPDLPISDPHPLPDEEVEQREAAEVLEEAIGHLDAREREVLELWRQGMPLNQIAKVMGIAHGSARSCKFYALRKLRRRLSGVLGEEIKEGRSNHD